MPQLDCDKVSLLVYRLPEDKPERSTALKLVKLGFAKRYFEERVPKSLIVLDPYADTILSKEDFPRAILVVDRSWKKLIMEGGMSRPKGGTRRRLPALRAANPVNYSRLFVLSSAEALASALFILGCKDRAEKILSVFKWGKEFFKLNEELLSRYSRANSRKEIELIEREAMEKLYGL